jgi:nucleoside-diphosphate-sugar epimerase
VVTGAAGFVGGAVARALRERGDEVIALDVRAGAGVRAADVSRPGDWEKTFDGADLVVHAAVVGAGGVGELAPVRAGRPTPSVGPRRAELRRAVLGGAVAVADACERAGVGRLVHVSCVSVLGDGAAAGAAAAGAAGAGAEALDETAPAGLTGDARADALAAAEQAVLSAAAHGLPATVVRLADAYGPRAGRWTLWPVLLLRAGRFALLDGGRGLVSPVYVDDVASAVLAVADARRAPRGQAGSLAGEVVHVTGGHAVSAADFFACYARMLRVDPPRSVPSRLYEATGGIRRRRAAPAGAAAAPGGRAPGARAGLVRGLGARLAAGAHPRAHIDVGPLSVAELTRSATYSIEKIRALTGWRPAVSLDEGMARTESWLRERGLLGVREPARRG